MLGKTFILVLLVSSSLLCTSLGCGVDGPDIATVEGTVTMDGKPLEGATVVFVPTGGRPAGGPTDANGKYVLNFSGGRKGAIPGENRVQITTKRDPSSDADGKPVPGKPETIPAEYNSRSTLKFDVKQGEKNIANFDLKSGGKVDGSQAYGSK